MITYYMIIHTIQICDSFQKNHKNMINTKFEVDRSNYTCAIALTNYSLLNIKSQNVGHFGFKNFFRLIFQRLPFSFCLV